MYMEPAFLSVPSYLPNIKLTYIELFKNQISFSHSSFILLSSSAQYAES